MSAEPEAAASARKRAAIAVAAIALNLLAALVARRRGYALGARTIVRCRRGHLFTTIWIPGASVKALRLGWLRLQRCPVGHHWTLVHPVRAASLTRSQRRSAGARRDVRLP